MALRNSRLPLPRHPADWTRERIDKLDRQEVEQLRMNAAGLGQERLRHCQLVMDGAAAEGLLVFGERLDGHIPEEKARSVHGVDPETVVHFKVEKLGEEYWAVWGKSAH